MIVSLNWFLMTPGPAVGRVLHKFVCLSSPTENVPASRAQVWDGGSLGHLQPLLALSLEPRLQRDNLSLFPSHGCPSPPSLVPLYPQISSFSFRSSVFLSHGGAEDVPWVRGVPPHPASAPLCAIPAPCVTFVQLLLPIFALYKYRNSHT